jgi:transposase-like protein
MKVYQKNKKSVKECIQVIDAESLMECATTGLLKLSVELGLGVIQDIFDYEVSTHAGEKGRHSKERTAYRHGTEATKVVLGGKKVSVERPRVRMKDGGGEIQLDSLAAFQEDDPLNDSVLALLLAGVSCRKYGRVQNADASTACTSRSEASRRFQSAMKTVMDEFFSRQIEGSYPALVIDGMSLGNITVIAAMGIKLTVRSGFLG